MGGKILSLKITNIMLALVLLIIPVIALGENGSSENTTIEAESSAVVTSGKNGNGPGLRTIVSIDAEDAYLPSILSIFDKVFTRVGNNFLLSYSPRDINI